MKKEKYYSFDAVMNFNKKLCDMKIKYATQLWLDKKYFGKYGRYRARVNAAFLLMKRKYFEKQYKRTANVI